jgi:acetylornithine deacetylase/succinyl-diaminopimelate desuccinylase-like protein
VSDVIAHVVRRTIELAQIPAPTGAEGDRARLVRSWWERDGLDDVHNDAIGNVWARARQGEGPAVVVCGHLDTVFGADVPHAVTVDGDRLLGPSVGDDAVGVAALSTATTSLPPDGLPVWLLATVGEEGLGNLRGVTAALADPPQRLGAFVAVEGNYLGRVSTIGVGSARRRVHVHGPGGHAWEDAETPSAVHAVVELAAAISTMPRREGTSVNVGRVGGGEGINIRAREAWLELDVRADDAAVLASLVEAVDAIVAQVAPPLEIEQEAIGERPAGRLRPDHALVRAAMAALAETGREVSSPPTSTDANAAHARGIPALAVGVTRGGGEHTPREWIETSPIEDGVRALTRTIERFEELSR